jgi:AcrR family transcriptional regulator
MDEPELPRAVALAWGIAANPQRGPKRELSIERIVEVAMRLADDGGLAAVSMAAVAGELGVTSMALYRYVTSKDDLLVLMQEEGIGLPPESIREAEGWRAGLEAWSEAMSGMYREHPWLLDVPVEGSPTTPNNLAWLDAALEVLEPVPLSGNQKTSTVLALVAQVRWENYIMRGYATSGEVPDALDTRIESMLRALVTADALPHVRAAIDAGVFSPEADGDPFAFGRRLVFDGLEALIAGRATVVERVAGDPLDAVVQADPKVREAIKRRREAEKQVREMRKREREAARNARERARKQNH